MAITLAPLLALLALLGLSLRSQPKGARAEYQATMRLVQMSGRFSYSGQSLRAAVLACIQQTTPDVIHITEVGSRARNRMLRGIPGYALLLGDPFANWSGEYESAILVRRAPVGGLWRPITWRSRILSMLRQPRRGSEKMSSNDAAFVHRRDPSLRFVVSGSHTNSDVDGGRGRWRKGGKSTAQNVRTQQDALVRWNRKAQSWRRSGWPPGLAADWNLALNDPATLRMLLGYFPGFKLAWPAGQPMPGTHGSRMIDGVLIPPEVECVAARVLSDYGASDHKAVLVVLKFQPASARK